MVNEGSSLKMSAKKLIDRCLAEAVETPLGVDLSRALAAADKKDDRTLPFNRLSYDQLRTILNEHGWSYPSDRDTAQQAVRFLIQSEYWKRERAFDKVERDLRHLTEFAKLHNMAPYSGGSRKEIMTEEVEVATADTPAKKSKKSVKKTPSKKASKKSEKKPSKNAAANAERKARLASKPKGEKVARVSKYAGKIEVLNKENPAREGTWRKAMIDAGLKGKTTEGAQALIDAQKEYKGKKVDFAWMVAEGYIAFRG